MLNSVLLHSPGACSLLPPLEPSLTASSTFFSLCLLPSLFFKWMAETLHPNLGRFLALLFLGPCSLSLSSPRQLALPQQHFIVKSVQIKILQ